MGSRSGGGGVGAWLLVLLATQLLATQPIESLDSHTPTLAHKSSQPLEAKRLRSLESPPQTTQTSLPQAAALATFSQAAPTQTASTQATPARKSHLENPPPQEALPHRLPAPSPLPIPDSLSPNLPLDSTEKREFIISYKAQSHDGVITGERYSVSDPITRKAHKLRIHHSCAIDTPINDLLTDDESYAIRYILTHYSDEVIDCLRKGLARLRYDGSFSHNTRVLDSAILHFPPQRILAYLENRYLIIDVLKE